MGKGETFRQWHMETMKRMLLLSMAFHAMVAIMLIVLPVPFQRALSLPPVYQVNLVTLPGPPEEVKAPEPPKAPEITKPKVVSKPLPELKKSPRELAKKETVTPTPKKSKPPGSKTPKAEAAIKSKEEIASVPSITATAAAEAPDFKFGFYTKLIERKIGEAWSPPRIERDYDTKEVVVTFVIITTGKVQEIQVEKSSGNTFFDQAALRAVYMANPLPPLPRGFRDPHLKIHFSFVLGRKG